MIVRLLRQPPRRRTSNAELSSVSHKATVNRKVRNSVHVGPPNWTRSRTFVLRITLAL